MSKYYTDQEAQQKLMQLLAEGKSITALKDDPKCPLDIKANLQQLDDIYKSLVISKLPKS